MVLLVKEQYLDQGDFPKIILTSNKFITYKSSNNLYEIWLHKDLTSAYIGFTCGLGLIPLGLAFFRLINLEIGIVQEELVEVKHGYRQNGLASRLYSDLLSHGQISAIFSDKTHFTSCKHFWKKLALKGLHKMRLQVNKELVKTKDNGIFTYNSFNFPDGEIWSCSGNDALLIYSTS